MSTALESATQQLRPCELRRYFKLILVTVNKRGGAYTRPGLESGSEKTKWTPAHLSTFTLEAAWMERREDHSPQSDQKEKHPPDLAGVRHCLLLPK